MTEADFLIEHADAIVTAGGTLRDGIIAGLAGRIVYVGPAADLAAHVMRRRQAMRIDATGCSLFPSTAPLAEGVPLDVLIVKGEDPTAIRMEIAGGKIVRWEQ